MTAAPLTPGLSQGKVLVVDDVPANRELIRDNLELRGWVVEEAPDGPTALERVRQVAPDVILLDVAMPGMDGLEVCRRLKADPLSAAIPVIMVTNHTERADRLAGIRAGANDYLPKPIDREDLALRVQNAAALKRMHDALQEKMLELKKCEALRDSLFHMVVHDLRSPLSIISMSLEMIPHLAEGPLGEEAAATLERASRGTKTMADMIGGLLDISRLEAGQMPVRLAPLDLSTMASEVVRDLVPVASGRRLSATAQANVPEVPGDGILVRRVLENLIGNAVKFTPQAGNIDVCVTLTPDRTARVSVQDDGPGIPPESLRDVFEKFCQVGDRKLGGSGLGLAFCRLAIEAQGGRIGVSSDGATGSTFWFELPLEVAGQKPALDPDKPKPAA